MERGGEEEESWRDKLDLVRCLKIGWKRAGVGEEEAQETLASTFNLYLTMPEQPGAPLALVLQDVPLATVRKFAQRLGAVGLKEVSGPLSPSV